MPRSGARAGKLAIVRLAALAIGALGAASAHGAATEPSRPAPHRPGAAPAATVRAVRSIDGSGNNLARPDLGRAGSQLLRFVRADYSDGVSAPAGENRRSAREISNLVAAQETSVENGVGASDLVWQWRQFLGHDLFLVPVAEPAEAASIAVPAGDAFFDPARSGAELLAFNRSAFDPQTGVAPDRPRQQINEVTAWLDGSQIYGSDHESAAALRSSDGTGRLRTGEDGLLPLFVDGLSDSGGSDPTLFLAGDVRANEQVGLIALHTLFVREHNRLADEIRARNPAWNDERIYQAARRIVIAELQAITYREFLPTLLGPGALPPYRGYDAAVDPSIRDAFAAAAFRFGHSAASPTVLRLGHDGAAIPAGHLALQDAFFAPWRVAREGGIDPILRGLAAQACQAVDTAVVEGLRSFLFGAPGHGGFDAAARSIQRGRDHGLPGYNGVREAYGLARAESFADVTSDTSLRAKLAAAYGDVDEIDAWVGGLAEDPAPGAMVGELIGTVVAEQFAALRDGDRFWWERTLGAADRARIERTRLADVIRRNTGIRSELSNDVFRAA